MNILKATRADVEAVFKIVYTTIMAVYPRYYPQGAVEFFLSHHSIENIARDAAENRVFLLLDDQRHYVGTVTVKANEMCRLFVLPEFQGKGYGRMLLDFAERRIAESYHEIILDASFPAKRIYLKRGYVSVDYHELKTNNGDFLCYDVMKKDL